MTDTAEMAVVTVDVPQAGPERLPLEAAQVVRRLVDVVLGGALLLLALPLIVMAAVAIRLDSPGPAFFRQVRVGRYGRPFTFLKLRGMYVDARTRWPELYRYDFASEEVGDLLFHPAVDPRVTRVGRLLRKTSIDELPNLWNVVRGDMSLVGPRPEIPEMMRYYGDALPTILSVKPGVTSFAKVSGRDELTLSQTIAADLEYVRRQSLALDLKILVATVVTVILQRGVLAG